MKKIVVCGDSFCASDIHDRDHFSQILEDDYGYKVINFARGGTDNIHICFQIKEAIAYEADIIIYSRTDSARMTVPLNGEAFDTTGNTLHNFAYPYPLESTFGKPYVGGVDAPFLSMTFHNLLPQTDPTVQFLHEQHVKVSDEIKEAVKMYVTFLHDQQLKHITEQWMYSYWNNEVIKNNIQLLIFNDGVGIPAYKFGLANQDYPKVYHTDRDTQLKVVDNILEKIHT
jgi:hypothetical protein|tara:strand:- start:44 stop:727 length:684 start_codon:yes stop_codon:yes gene_type:complete